MKSLSSVLRISAAKSRGEATRIACTNHGNFRVSPFADGYKPTEATLANGQPTYRSHDIEKVKQCQIR